MYQKIYIFPTPEISSMESKEKYVKSLTKIGMSIPESRVYLALLDLKESKTGILSEKANVASSKIYNVLNNLIEKGFVGYKLQNNQKIFFAFSPKIIEDILEKKQGEEKSELLSMVEELKQRSSENSSYSGYKYYEGMTAIRALWLELTEDLEKFKEGEEVLVYAGIKDAYKLMLGLYEEFHKIRVKYKIKYKIIYPMEENDLPKKRGKQLAQIRFMELENEAEWAIVGNKLIIQYITQKIPRGFLIEDKIFVQTFKQVYNQLWKVAKK